VPRRPFLIMSPVRVHRGRVRPPCTQSKRFAAALARSRRPPRVPSVRRAFLVAGERAEQLVQRRVGVGRQKFFSRPPPRRPARFSCRSRRAHRACRRGGWVQGVGLSTVRMGPGGHHIGVAGQHQGLGVPAARCAYGPQVGDAESYPVRCRWFRRQSPAGPESRCAITDWTVRRPAA
jgi:hypothetical protein